jgi:hypothetical protein
MMKSKKSLSAFEIESSDLVSFESEKSLHFEGLLEEDVFSRTMGHGDGFSTIEEGCSGSPHHRFFFFAGLFTNGCGKEA